MLEVVGPEMAPCNLNLQSPVDDIEGRHDPVELREAFEYVSSRGDSLRGLVIAPDAELQTGIKHLTFRSVVSLLLVLDDPGEVLDVQYPTCLHERLRGGQLRGYPISLKQI